jgi:peptidyl-prolyl cis-trans isomerase C
VVEKAGFSPPFLFSFRFKMNLRQLSLFLSFFILCFSSAATLAAAAVVAEGLGVTVTVDDLNADAQRIQAAMRPQALSEPAAVQQAASNLFIRRALAAEAERDGAANDPVVAAALRIARDRVLSDVTLAKIDAANKPSNDAVETAARAAYKANPERFRTGEQTHARHILIEGNTDKAKAKAEKVLTDLKAGADFEKTAKELSADPGSAPRGGDLGYFETGKMVPEFDEALQQLKKPGEMSGLVRTQFGWHIIKLEGRRPGGQRSYDEVRDELRQLMTNQLHSDARLREATRLAGNAKFNTEAIEAFSAPYRKR